MTPIAADATVDSGPDVTVEEFIAQAQIASQRTHDIVMKLILLCEKFDGSQGEEQSVVANIADN